jgi:DNA-binding transcriptional LysR family regulator
MNPTLDSRQLLAFATLARCGSFTHTAREIFLTQSAVSHAIKALEHEVGARLFDRLGKKAHLTQAGELLLRSTERILREMHDARTGLEELQNWGHSRLRLGTSPTACQYLLPTVLREFKQSFPQCVIRIEPGDGPKMIDLLRSTQIDLALMLEPAELTDITFRHLFEDELRMIVSPQHPCAKKGRVVREEISSETVIIYNKGSYTFQMIEEYFRRDRVSLQNPIELGSMEAIKELVKIGLGAGILTPWITQKEILERSLVSLPLGAQKLRRHWGVAHQRGRRLALAEETFVGLCTSVAEALGLKVRSSVTKRRPALG